MYIKVIVSPSSRKESILKENDTLYRIGVREPAMRNQANKRVQTLLADLFGVKQSAVRLITGHRSPNKVFDINL